MALLHQQYEGSASKEAKPAAVRYGVIPAAIMVQVKQIPATMATAVKTRVILSGKLLTVVTATPAAARVLHLAVLHPGVLPVLREEAPTRLPESFKLQPCVKHSPRMFCIPAIL